MPDASPTILLVDDEDSVRTVLAFPLERDGYTVIQAADGDEALRLFDATQIDLVVLDIMLPKLDGLEVCKRLRTTSNVPIIMLTARDDELDKVIGLELGADDYITKPFSIREFRSRVRALLRRARSQPDPATDERIEHEGLVIDVARRTVEVRGRTRPAHVRRVRAAAGPRDRAGPRLQPPDAARRRSGRAPITAIRARSTSTSAISARSSRPSRARPSTS